jgi:ABC-2 type transport system permease protein
LENRNKEIFRNWSLMSKSKYWGGFDMRYIRLYRELLIQSVMKLMAYRANFFLVFITNLAYFAVQIIFLQVIFSKVDSLAGWTKYEMIFYIGTFNIIDSLWVFGPYFNLVNLPELIRNGMLDYYITKPVNSQFIVSLRNVEIGSLTSVLAGTAIIGYALTAGNMSITFGRVILYIIAIFHALLVEYAVYFIMTCLSFWTVKTDFVEKVHGITCYFSNRPIDIYKGVIRFILCYILPYGFVMTIAAKSAVKSVGAGEYAGFLLLSWCFFGVSILLWRFSLRRYSSASS